MDISVTEFKQHCLEIIRSVEQSGRSVILTRRGKVIARLSRLGPIVAADTLPPWEQLRMLGGSLLAAPGESVIRDEDFEVLRMISGGTRDQCFCDRGWPNRAADQTPASADWAIAIAFTRSSLHRP